jgi:hypothetical protein
MKQRASEIFPFGIAVILPPAGIVLGLIAMQEDQDLGLRITGVAILALIVWVLLLTL